MQIPASFTLVLNALKATGHNGGSGQSKNPRKNPAGIKDDAKKLVRDMLGPEIAEQLDNFSDPQKYPKDFINECVYFIGKFIGEEAARKRLKFIADKYKIRTS